MTKNNTKSNIIVATITLVLLVVFAGYFIKSSAENEKREEIESLARIKESAYNDYINSVKDIVDSKKTSDQVQVAILSDNAIYDVVVEYKEYKKETKKGNEYLDKLKEEATKNLNSSIHFLLSNGISRENYDKIRIFANNPDYVSKDNIALFEEVESKFDNMIAQELQEQREALGEVQTGYSEKEVKLIMGSPKETTKNNEAEFWTYEDLVLVMKNGYVYEIVYSNE